MVDYIRLEEYAKNKCVLFVEDDEDIIKETKELLELIFPQVFIARNGKEGFEKYLQFYNENGKYFDLVITDIQMPIMNGIEFTELVYKERKEQLLIVLSAHSESNYLMQLVNIGISHFIQKPLKYDSFVHVLYTKLEELTHNESGKADEIELYLNEELKWDKNLKIMYMNDKLVKLTKKETYLLELLLKYKEKTHNVDEILNYMWADDNNSSPDISNLKNIISRLRKKLPSLDIENIYGFGYRINIK